MDYAKLREFRQALSTAPHLFDLKAICRAFCNAVGVEYYLFGVCEVISLAAPKMIVLTNFPGEWVDWYFQTRSSNIDPILQYSFANSAPVLWSELENMHEYRASAGVYLDVAKSFGLHRGLTVPLNPPTGQTAFFNIVSADPHMDEDRLGNLLSPAGTFTKFLFDAYIRIDKIENPKVNKLTERELECVFWACEGKTTWEMAQIVGVAARTINFHLTSVIKKLGASNRQHAVAKAIMYGLVKPRP